MPSALRNRRALAGLAGMALMLLALLLLWANERQALVWNQAMARHGDKLLDRGGDARPGSDEYGHMLRVTGTPVVVEAPRDDQFNVQADTPQLLRTVEMFQWREIRIGDDIHYEQDWVDHAVDSSAFAQTRGHANPGPLPIHAASFVAPGVRLGGFALAPSLVRALPMLTHRVPVKVTQIPPNMAASLRQDGDGLTTSPRGDSPQLGDLRIRWQAVDVRPVTVIARVDGARLVPAVDAAPGEGFQVQLGVRSLRDVLSDLPERPHSVWAWRTLALLIALGGTTLLLREVRRPPTDMLAALALAVAPVAALIGLLWVGRTTIPAVAALLLAVLAVVGAVHRLRGSGRTRR